MTTVSRGSRRRLALDFRLTPAGLFFLPALVLLAGGGVKLWREQSGAGAAR